MGAFIYLAACGIFVAPCLAASPSLGSISPQGGQRGTERDVRLSGARLADAQEVLLYSPGITVTKIEPIDENSFKTHLVIAPDCRLGVHAMRVRTATGISELRTFYVGPFKEIAEAEPNSDFAAPQKIELDTTTNGVVENEDVDYFAVEAKQGERISAEVEGIRLGNTFFDPYLAIMDAGRFELASSDDAALVWQDGVASIVAPKDGTYIIQLRESAYGGNGSCGYRLHVGRFPRTLATVPGGGRPGETVQVRWLGDVTGEWTESVTLPTEPLRVFGLHAHDDRGISPSANVFRLANLENVIEAEPNNSTDQANAFEAPRALNGVIQSPGDVDCFKFPATKGQVFDVRVYGRAIRSPIDSVLNIYRATGGGNVGGSDDSGGPDSYVRFTAPEDDQYILVLNDHLQKGGPTYAYRIELAPVAPQLTMGLPERSQFVDITTSVPKGNRMAILVSAGRADFGGDLKVDFQGLPASVAFETTIMAANQSIVPVLFTATADAQLAGALVDVIGSHTDPNQPISGHLFLSTSLVRGQNNVRVWDHVEDRMALAVTDESPFAIEIVEPKVPLVRNGTMQLRVVAKRKEGFTAPIAIRMLYDPPGTGSAGSIAIPEGQTEAAIPLNANGGAEIRKWPIAVIGEAAVGNGSVLVSSQLANLDVAESFFGFAFQAAAVEQAQETDVVIKVTTGTPYEGPAQVELLGLPNEVTTVAIQITKDSAEAVFKVKTTANSPAGKHATLLCRAIVTRDGEPITHMLGTGELRIDTPLPPKANEPAPMPQAAAAPAPEQPVEKRLTQLEKLRLAREQAKAAKAPPKSE